METYMRQVIFVCICIILNGIVKLEIFYTCMDHNKLLVEGLCTLMVMHIYDDDDDVYLDKLQTRGVKISILYM
jgi:hypothetical protein